MASHCPRCRELVEPTASSCSRCGAPQPQSVACPNCGRTSRAGDRFCGTCGQALGEATAVLPAAPETSPTAWWQRRPAWMLALALGVVLLVLGLGLGWLFRSAAPAVPADDGTPSVTGSEPPAATASPTAPSAETGGVTGDRWSDSTMVGGSEVASGFRDYTDREKIHRIAGRWMVEIGGGWATVVFTETMTREVQENNIHVNYYDASSRTFPPYYTVVRLPDGGNFLAFQHPDGEYGDVFENIAFHDANTFSFTRGGIGKRFFAYRTTADGVVSRREARSAPGTGEERSTAADESAGEETAAPGPASEAVEMPTPTPTPDAAAIRPPEPRSVRQLWEEARRLREDEHFHSLVAVLDALLDADPHHEKAREWRSRCAPWIREQEEEETERARDFIDELAEAISDRDLDDVFELWDERPDAATRSYFQNLFGRYRVLRARGMVQSIRIRDATASFTAEIVIEGKREKGRRNPFVLVAEHRWHGELRDRRFVRSFP